MSTAFTYSSNTLMMHLQDLVGVADKIKSWYEPFDLENQLKVCLMEKHLVKSDGVSLVQQKNVIIWSISVQ